MCVIARRRPRTTRGICDPVTMATSRASRTARSPSDAAQPTASSNSSGVGVLRLGDARGRRPSASGATPRTGGPSAGRSSPSTSSGSAAGSRPARTRGWRGTTCRRRRGAASGCPRGRGSAPRSWRAAPSSAGGRTARGRPRTRARGGAARSGRCEPSWRARPSRSRGAGPGCRGAARRSGRGAAAGRRIRRGPSPTGMSMRPGSAIRRPWLRTRTSPVTPSPATTRSCASAQVHVVRTRPEEEGDARDEEQQRDRAGHHPLDPAEERSRARAPRSRRARRSAPAGRTVRALHSAAAASAAPIARQTPAHHTTTRTRAPPRRAEVTDGRGDLRAHARAGRGRGAGEAGLGQAHTASRLVGGATSSSTWPTTASCVTPSNSASGCRISRCESTATASALTSSGVA